MKTQEIYDAIDAQEDPLQFAIETLRKDLDKCTYSFDGREKMRSAMQRFELALKTPKGE